MTTIERTCVARRVRRLSIAATVAACAGLSFGLAGRADAQTVTDPTRSVSLGVPVGAGGSNADGSVFAYSWDGCARSGLVAVSANHVSEVPFTAEQRPTLYQASGHQAQSCTWSTNGSATAPVAVGEADSRGAVSYSRKGTAYGQCFNPFNLDCLPSVAIAGGTYRSAHGGTISYGGDSCTAYDWGPVPGVAYCGGNLSDDSASSTGSIAVMDGEGTARGRLFAYSGGDSDPWSDGHAHSDNVAMASSDNAYGGKVAVSESAEAHSGAGGVAVALTNLGTGPCSTDAGYDRPSNAYTGPGGVAVAGCDATGGAVTVAGRNANSNGGAVAVSATGNACGATVYSLAPRGRAC